jgi:hypothetical protein
MNGAHQHSPYVSKTSPTKSSALILFLALFFFITFFTIPVCSTNAASPTPSIHGTFTDYPIGTTPQSLLDALHQRDSIFLKQKVSQQNLEEASLLLNERRELWNNQNIDHNDDISDGNDRNDEKYLKMGTNDGKLTTIKIKKAQNSSNLSNNMHTEQVSREIDGKENSLHDETPFTININDHNGKATPNNNNISQNQNSAFSAQQTVTPIVGVYRPTFTTNRVMTKPPYTVPWATIDLFGHWEPHVGETRRFTVPIASSEYAPTYVNREFAPSFIHLKAVVQYSSGTVNADYLSLLTVSTHRNIVVTNVAVNGVAPPPFTPAQCEISRYSATNPTVYTWEPVFTPSSTFRTVADPRRVTTKAAFYIERPRTWMMSTFGTSNTVYIQCIIPYIYDSAARTYENIPRGYQYPIFKHITSDARAAVRNVFGGVISAITEFRGIFSAIVYKTIALANYPLSNNLYFIPHMFNQVQLFFHDMYGVPGDLFKYRFEISNQLSKGQTLAQTLSFLSTQCIPSDPLPSQPPPTYQHMADNVRYEEFLRVMNSYPNEDASTPYTSPIRPIEGVMNQLFEEDYSDDYFGNDNDDNRQDSSPKQETQSSGFHFSPTQYNQPRELPQCDYPSIPGVPKLWKRVPSLTCYTTNGLTPLFTITLTYESNVATLTVSLLTTIEPYAKLSWGKEGTRCLFGMGADQIAIQPNSSAISGLSSVVLLQGSEDKGLSGLIYTMSGVRQLTNIHAAPQNLYISKGEFNPVYTTGGGPQVPGSLLRVNFDFVLSVPPSTNNFIEYYINTFRYGFIQLPIRFAQNPSDPSNDSSFIICYDFSTGSPAFVLGSVEILSTSTWRIYGLSDVEINTYTIKVSCEINALDSTLLSYEEVQFYNYRPRFLIDQAQVLIPSVTDPQVALRIPDYGQTQGKLAVWFTRRIGQGPSRRLTSKQLNQIEVQKMHFLSFRATFMGPPALVVDAAHVLLVVPAVAYVFNSEEPGYLNNYIMRCTLNAQDGQKYQLSAVVSTSIDYIYVFFSTTDVEESVFTQAWVECIDIPLIFMANADRAFADASPIQVLTLLEVGAWEKVTMTPDRAWVYEYPTNDDITITARNTPSKGLLSTITVDFPRSTLYYALSSPWMTLTFPGITFKTTQHTTNCFTRFVDSKTDGLSQFKLTSRVYKTELDTINLFSADGWSNWSFDNREDFLRCDISLIIDDFDPRYMRSGTWQAGGYTQISVLNFKDMWSDIRQIPPLPMPFSLHSSLKLSYINISGGEATSLGVTTNVLPMFEFTLGSTASGDHVLFSPYKLHRIDTYCHNETTIIGTVSGYDIDPSDPSFHDVSLIDYEGNSFTLLRPKSLITIDFNPSQSAQFCTFQAVVLYNDDVPQTTSLFAPLVGSDSTDFVDWSLIEYPLLTSLPTGISFEVENDEVSVTVYNSAVSTNDKISLLLYGEIDYSQFSTDISRLLELRTDPNKPWVLNDTDDYTISIRPYLGNGLTDKIGDVVVDQPKVKLPWMRPKTDGDGDGDNNGDSGNGNGGEYNLQGSMMNGFGMFNKNGVMQLEPSLLSKKFSKINVEGIRQNVVETASISENLAQNFEQISEKVPKISSKKNNFKTQQNNSDEILNQLYNSLNPSTIIELTFKKRLGGSFNQVSVTLPTTLNPKQAHPMVLFTVVGFIGNTARSAQGFIPAVSAESLFSFRIFQSVEKTVKSINPITLVEFDEKINITPVEYKITPNKNVPGLKIVTDFFRAGLPPDHEHNSCSLYLDPSASDKAKGQAQVLEMYYNSTTSYIHTMILPELPALTESFIKCDFRSTALTDLEFDIVASLAEMGSSQFARTTAISPSIPLPPLHPITFNIFSIEVSGAHRISKFVNFINDFSLLFGDWIGQVYNGEFKLNEIVALSHEYTTQYNGTSAFSIDYYTSTPQQYQMGEMGINFEEHFDQNLDTKNNPKKHQNYPKQSKNGSNYQYLDEIDPIPFLHSHPTKPLNLSESRPYYMYNKENNSFFSFFARDNIPSTSSPYLNPLQIDLLNRSFSENNFGMIGQNQQNNSKNGEQNQIELNGSKFVTSGDLDADIEEYGEYIHFGSISEAHLESQKKLSNLVHFAKKNSTFGNLASKTSANNLKNSYPQHNPPYFSTIRSARVDSTTPIDDTPYIVSKLDSNRNDQKNNNFFDFSYTHLHNSPNSSKFLPQQIWGPIAKDTSAIGDPSNKTMDLDGLEVTSATIFNATIRFRLPERFNSTILTSFFSEFIDNTVFYTSYDYSIQFKLVNNSIDAIIEEEMCYSGQFCGHSCPDLCALQFKCTSDFDCASRYCNTNTGFCDEKLNKDELLNKIKGKN